MKYLKIIAIWLSKAILVLTVLALATILREYFTPKPDCARVFFDSDTGKFEIALFPENPQNDQFRPYSKLVCLSIQKEDVRHVGRDVASCNRHLEELLKVEIQILNPSIEHPNSTILLEYLEIVVKNPEGINGHNFGYRMSLHPGEAVEKVGHLNSRDEALYRVVTKGSEDEGLLFTLTQREAGKLWSDSQSFRQLYKADLELTLAAKEKVILLAEKQKAEVKQFLSSIDQDEK